MRIRKAIILCALLICIASALLIGCGEKQNRTVILATTTSTYDTGLLDQIEPLFLEKTGYTLKIVAVGTGEALRMGREKAADVLLVHAKPAEEKFIAQGHGVERVPVMHNDFVILGPQSNPAQIGMNDLAVDAFKTIAVSKVPFVSRGDNSGTYKKEQSIWKEAGTKPDKRWYIETGQGMGASLKIADEKQAYILTDRGTFYSIETNLDLTILNAGSKQLLNHYSVIEVTPGPEKTVNTKGARAFRNFITSTQCQQLIRAFRKNNKQLFHPDVLPK
jgi:tungstate transport system substrate-binding protein